MEHNNKYQAPIRITVRNITHPELRDLPRYWYADPGKTAYFNSLSIVIEILEELLTLALLPIQKTLEDGPLKDQVYDLLHQESIHSREHRYYNKALEKQGFPTTKLANRVRKVGLKMLEDRKSIQDKVLFIAAIEHYAATICHQFLSRKEDMLIHAYPPIVKFWVWHAVEEIEHKGVAFDLYLKLSGRQPTSKEKIKAFSDAVKLIVLHKAYGTWLFMKTDRLNWKPKAWVGFIRMMFKEPALLSGFIPRLTSWLHDGFHPWKYDDSALTHGQLNPSNESAGILMKN